ncbi:uncharacterized protein Z520_11374 [Fonsecaea multimorphosa CBS 102226]|uniref:Uncharacterized protein n=1 Tax=Fonsecaea multimorphosa CBS 102226 TaxID=1442371 RepID=A0A0D2K973_9EURO|nr:uncharacterized protein Z520_11374 [Fonsecaea multimorphosa CBS 102226]KIX92898.1 hypothetical protein Z520_11374 [Fonsecaea multimorphosa CBS 102226]OAL18148.1 hypothetical protein AYO22_10925 [Fonsecaea multimorphosa]
MVLLTSSTVSVIISSGVVCMFTFLLFLSGYVLQQQSVRSIQEAIRRPPERKPVPTLPPQFQHEDNDTVPKVLEQPQDGSQSVMVIEGIQGAGREGDMLDSVQVPVIVEGQNGAPLDASPELSGSPSRDQMPLQRLAYMFALLEPHHLCSALLFAKHQRSSSRLSKEPSIVLLYPSTWETDFSPLYTSTLSFMREIQELHNLIYHPVRIYDAWDVRSQLLGELQWGRWDYDQALFLRSPGMVIDSQMLDAALASPDTRKTWAPLNPSSGDDPDLLLITPRGLQSPRREPRKLVSSASANIPDAGDDGVQIRELGQGPAYVLLDNQALSDEENDVWFDEIKRKFGQETSNVCGGSGLLEDNLKLALQRTLR